MFFYGSGRENPACLFFRTPYTAIWIFRVTQGNYPLHVIYAIPLRVFGFTIFEINHIYNIKEILYNIDTYYYQIRNIWLSRVGALGGFFFIHFYDSNIPYQYFHVNNFIKFSRIQIFYKVIFL